MSALRQPRTARQLAPGLALAVLLVVALPVAVSGQGQRTSKAKAKAQARPKAKVAIQSKPLKPAKPVEVRCCPMTCETVTDPKAQPVTFRNYRVYFCSTSCRPAFEKFGDADKEKMIRIALQKLEPQRRK